MKWLLKFIKWLRRANPDIKKEQASETAPHSYNLLFKYGGFDGSKHTRDESITISMLDWVTHNTFRYRLSNRIPWGAFDKDKNGRPIVGFVCMFVKDGDNWVGGKFDRTRPGTVSRDVGNIENGYGKWKEPRPGEPCVYGIFSNDGTKRCSNLEETTWKGK